MRKLMPIAIVSIFFNGPHAVGELCCIGGTTPTTVPMTNMTSDCTGPNWKFSDSDCTGADTCQAVQCEVQGLTVFGGGCGANSSAFANLAQGTIRNELPSATCFGFPGVAKAFAQSNNSVIEKSTASQQSSYSASITTSLPLPTITSALLGTSTSAVSLATNVSAINISVVATFATFSSSSVWNASLTNVSFTNMSVVETSAPYSSTGSGTLLFTTSPTPVSSSAVAVPGIVPEYCCTGGITPSTVPKTNITEDCTGTNWGFSNSPCPTGTTCQAVQCDVLGLTVFGGGCGTSPSAFAQLAQNTISQQLPSGASCIGYAGVSQQQQANSTTSLSLTSTTEPPVPTTTPQPMPTTSETPPQYCCTGGTSAATVPRSNITEDCQGDHWYYDDSPCSAGTSCQAWQCQVMGFTVYGGGCGDSPEEYAQLAQDTIQQHSVSADCVGFPGVSMPQGQMPAPGSPVESGSSASRASAALQARLMAIHAASVVTLTMALLLSHWQ